MPITTDKVAGAPASESKSESQSAKVPEYSEGQEVAVPIRQGGLEEAPESDRDASEKQKLKRTLGARHLVLISLGGVVSFEHSRP